MWHRLSLIFDIRYPHIMIWYDFCWRNESIMWSNACAPCKMIHKEKESCMLNAVAICILLLVFRGQPTLAVYFYCPFSCFTSSISSFGVMQPSIGGVRHMNRFDPHQQCCSRLFQTEFKTISFDSAFARIYRSITFFGVVRNIGEETTTTTTTNRTHHAVPTYSGTLNSSLYKYVLILYRIVRACVC